MLKEESLTSVSLNAFLFTIINLEEGEEEEKINQILSYFLYLIMIFLIDYFFVSSQQNLRNNSRKTYS